MFLLFVVFVCAQSAAGEDGWFWQVTDFHYDPRYSTAGVPGAMCHESGGRQDGSPGVWGDYLCDAPWALINSSVYAMRQIEPNPDFILWTGDDTPHVPNEELGQQVVINIIGNLTSLLKEVFPTKRVYAALGNHDYHPKNQLPPSGSDIYDAVAEFWRDWMDDDTANNVFKQGGYYTVSHAAHLRIVSVNTNLHYRSNLVTKDMEDPGGHFAWLDRVLGDAQTNSEMVFIVGHLPPGFFELKRSQYWMYPNFNERYNELVRKHSAVIAGQFFGHHHTDSFRVFYDDEGSAVSSMFLCPAVTPWKTTLPGISGFGANNPGVRLYKYDRQTLQIKDVVQYYTNLTEANLSSRPVWQEAYSLTGNFGLADGGTDSLHRLAASFTGPDASQFRRYHQYNTLSYDPTETCDTGCWVDHVCSIIAVGHDDYDVCVRDKITGGASESKQIQAVMMALTCLFTVLLTV
ncbi:SMPDL3B [Branchiostoma lanceolatum]|uniref:Sphingomyelinase phosphodiesterase n=1 Tax=Branchiostoma lanceolatum TaxID=7740 RepID=A0A8J9ZFL5_BRALA|nr:SMPDL3B [Branchiostoma lanceolatum]